MHALSAIVVEGVRSIFSEPQLSIFFYSNNPVSLQHETMKSA